MNPDFEAAFRDLKAILELHASEMVVKIDEPGKFYLTTNLVQRKGQPLWIGGVEVKKNYVSFHWVPVYIRPKLLETLSDSLMKRMQGKGCFNFKKSDPALFDEINLLIKTSLESLIAEPVVL